VAVCRRGAWIVSTASGIYLRFRESGAMEPRTRSTVHGSASKTNRPVTAGTPRPGDFFFIEEDVMDQWHVKTAARAIASLRVDPSRGLDSAEASRRLETGGYNRLAARKRKNLFLRVLEQFRDVLIYILLAAAAVSVLLGEGSDALIILAVVVINAVVGVVQESKAEKALEALKKLAAPKAVVLRDGSPREIPSEEVVPGDILIIEAGRVIPCDLRWIEAVNLKVEEASLTGESVPVEKRADATVEEAAPLGDRVTMGYSSTLATYGRGIGLAVGTGMDTELGRIATILDAEEQEETPLQKKLDNFGRKLGVVILVLCGFMFALAAGKELIRHGIIAEATLFEIFLTSVSLAVAAIPEGMVAIVTIVLAIGVQRMSREKAIVRRLPAVETLGAVTMICSDKTGTLTRNRMSVAVWSADGLSGDASTIDPSKPGQRLLLEAIALCNDASLGPPGPGSGNQPAATGDPTEIALLELSQTAGVSRTALLSQAPRIGELPFDSERKMMSTVHAREAGRQVMTKGAADRLLERCDRVMVDGAPVALEAGKKQAILAEADAMAGKALRVLGAAYRPLGAGEKAEGADLEKDLIFLGLVGMIDPPRLEVKDSIALCRASGIGVSMITGDHKATALAIASALGIAKGEEEALAGPEIDGLDDAMLAERVKTVRVFARVSPEHKVRIVKAFRADGHIVSMTGDGVNDAPSLKAADIGVAMGITGTDVAKGASDIILADDNFRTIVRAIEEGRNIYANIRKAIFFLLSCNLGEIFCILLPILIGMPIPLLPIHLLWVNLVTDTFPALALGMDPGDPDAIKQKPRNPKESLFAHGGIPFVAINGLVKGSLALAAFLIGLSLGGGDESGLALARTMAFCVLSLTQLFHAFNARHETKSLISIGPFKNRWLIGAFLLCSFIQVIVVLVPGLTSFFKLVGLNAAQWGIVWLLSISTIFLNESAKFLVRTIVRIKGGKAAVNA
jgi:Ca2+-transporting ATPase